VAWAPYISGSGHGSIVLTNINTNTSIIAYNFSESEDDGYNPTAVTYDSNSSTIYGVTEQGGSDYGTIFSYNIQSSSIQRLYSFTSDVYAYAIVYANNSLFVTLNQGGSGDGGIGLYNLISSSYQDLYNFSTSGDGGNSPEGSWHTFFSEYNKWLS
jgi:uncharacterized repeat protein (TIGR03803 family)